MKMKDKLWQIFAYSGVSRKEYEQIRNEIHRSNRKRFQSFSLMAVIFLSVMLGVVLSSDILEINYWVYLAPLIVLTVMLFLNTWVTKNSPILTKLFIYVFITLMMLMAIAVGTVENKDQAAGTFLAFLLAIPMVFILRPAENIFLIILSDILFVLTACQVKEHAIYRVDVVNAFVIGAISMILSTYMTTVEVENLTMKASLQKLAEIDQLTQIPNRTCYARNLKNYPTICQQNLACVYADANGLHELNALKGHYAGDLMLKCLANGLEKSFGHLHSYRIGGDEFVVFAADIDVQTLEEKINAVRSMMEENGYHAALGYAIQDVDSLNMDELVKTAEERMYANKDQFYGRTASRHGRKTPIA